VWFAIGAKGNPTLGRAPSLDTADALEQHIAIH
jgi:hypothetical protein